jgi:hypothetical protein
VAAFVQEAHRCHAKSFLTEDNEEKKNVTRLQSGAPLPLFPSVFAVRPDP